MNVIAGLLALADGHPFLFIMFICALSFSFWQINGTIRVLLRGWPTDFYIDTKRPQAPSPPKP